MKQIVEVAIEYAGSVISSFGTNGVPNGISAIKEISVIDVRDALLKIIYMIA